MSSIFGDPPACLECGRPVEQLDPIHGRYRTVHSWCVNRRRERLRREREGVEEPQGPQEAAQTARRGRNGRPAYSICRQCGRRIPPPAHGPMRLYCDRACENAWRRAQARAAEEAYQQAVRRAEIMIEDIEARAARMEAETAASRAFLRHAQARLAANQDMLARWDPEGAQEPPTQGS